MKVCVVTGSRAEYDLLKLLMNEIKKDTFFRLQLVVTGSHLSSELGYTLQHIEEDGWEVNEKVDLLINSDSPVGVLQSMGRALPGFAESYDRLGPDLVVLLGDRYEILCAAIAAHVQRVPIAHIHGGETTVGAFDNAFRHAITKMASLHLTAHEIYRKRVIQLGEAPKTVHVVGALGVDAFKQLPLMNQNELEAALEVRLQKRNLLVCFHPVTLENDTSGEQFTNLLQVIDGLADTQIFFTKANADTHGRVINTLIDDYVIQHPHKAKVYASLGQRKFFSLLKCVDAIVGNSSSGIIEAPCFRIGTINIGDRQTGRIKADSVIDCEPSMPGIEEAFEHLDSKAFKITLKNFIHPYGEGDAAHKIARILKKEGLCCGLKKNFIDLDFVPPSN